MVVVVLTNCPPKLRGDLSMWLFEINTGVYVGNISARVRDLLWERICSNVKHGQASMVFSTSGEQKLDFRVYNTSWSVVDFDGIKLMRRPNSKQSIAKEALIDRSLDYGFSAVSRFEKNKHFQLSSHKKIRDDENYIVIDIETTGLSHLSDNIIEIAAIKVKDGNPIEEFQSLIKCEFCIPEQVTQLTGITNEDLEKDGRGVREVLIDFIQFISDQPLVCHNMSFDINFIQATCKKNNIKIPKNKCIDTLVLAKRKLKFLTNYRLETIAEVLEIPSENHHRALRDCYITYNVYNKLKEK